MKNRTHLDWHNEIRKTLGLSELSNDIPTVDREKQELLKKLRRERHKNQQLKSKQPDAEQALSDEQEK